MAYIFDSKTQKYNVYVEIFPSGINPPKKIIIGSFDNENCAIAGADVAKTIMNNAEIFKIPTNKQINNWISSKLKY